MQFLARVSSLAKKIKKNNNFHPFQEFSMGYSYLNISQKNLEIITHASIFQPFLSNERTNLETGWKEYGRGTSRS